MRFSPIKAARTIARIDQEVATFEELFKEWINTDGNRERLDEFYFADWPKDPFEICNATNEDFAIYLARDAMMQVRFGDLIEDSEAAFVLHFIEWFQVYRNRIQLLELERELGDWNELLINAFFRSQSDEAIVNCFASYRIRQLTSKVFSKLYFSEEEPAE